MDYKSILMRYIAHVIDVEGDSFIHLARTEPQSKRKVGVQFTSEEIKELEILEQDARETYNP